MMKLKLSVHQILTYHISAYIQEMTWRRPGARFFLGAMMAEEVYKLIR